MHGFRILDEAPKTSWIAANRMNPTSGGEWDNFRSCEAFVFVERRTNDTRSSRIGFMHGAAGVSKGFLSETLRIPARFRALRP